MQILMQRGNIRGDARRRHAKLHTRKYYYYARKFISFGMILVQPLRFVTSICIHI